MSIKPQKKSSLQHEGQQQATERGDPWVWTCGPILSIIIASATRLNTYYVPGIYSVLHTTLPCNFHHICKRWVLLSSPFYPQGNKCPQKAGTCPRSHKQVTCRAGTPSRIQDPGSLHWANLLPVTETYPKFKNKVRGRQRGVAAGPPSVANRAIQDRLSRVCSHSPRYSLLSGMSSVRLHVNSEIMVQRLWLQCPVGH